MSVLRVTPHGTLPAGDCLAPLLDSLRRQQPVLVQTPVSRLLALLDDFAGRLPSDPRTREIEGVAYLAAWLRRPSLQQILELNLHGNPAFLDGLVPVGRGYLAAKPHGLVAMWMAGNVPALPLFSLVPALLAKNVCLAKLASPETQATERLLAVLAESQGEGLTGQDLLAAMALVWFDYRRRELNEELSQAADAQVIWGGREAVRAIAALPRAEHCVQIVFGPKYSIGLVDRRCLESGNVQAVAAGFGRDIAAFDQRACSAPQTIFIERNARHSIRQVGEIFSRQLERLPPNADADAYTTMQILSARARYAMDPERDVLASSQGVHWTVCMDREPVLKEAVQSRTLFLTEVGSWREVVPLLSPRVQTVGMAFGEEAEALAFAEAATAAGVARCVPPGTMNHFESPWDGKLLVHELVRWVTFKPWRA